MDMGEENGPPLLRVAIVGLSGRFPGANTPDALWEMLAEGREGIARPDEAALKAACVPEEVYKDPAYVRAAGMLDTPDHFDASFFGISPAEAEAMDPQQRVFLECAVHALEDAGMPIGEIDVPVGVYAGAGFSSYLLANAQELLRRADGNLFEALIGNDKDFLCSRISYLLGLTGPSVTVQTACSSSLVAVHMAAQSLLNGECDVALAGGVSISFPHGTGYIYREGGILSPDGHCRAFDADAAGTVGAGGAGIVVLKRYEDAIADGDHVRAVLRATSINNDGNQKIGYTAPLSSGQAEVISECLSIAQLDAEDIDYVECHGTGTPLGDPIEIEALNMAYGLNRADHQCLIGSLKSNIGHLDTAAGVAGLIKLVLSLEHELLPASVNYQTPNPKIPFENGPFVVNDRATPWRRNSERPRIAGLSAFGIGGTNAHVIVEEAPERPPAPPLQRVPVIIPYSAKSAEALSSLSLRLAGAIEKCSNVAAFADIAYSQAIGRIDYSHRAVVVADTAEQAAQILRKGEKDVGVTDARGAVFLFPGQGSQMTGCGAVLYRKEPVFRDAIDKCIEAASGRDVNLRKLLFEVGADTLRETRYAQPTIFAQSYALAELWESWGVVPAAMIGHSLGEYVAACRTDVFSLSDALHLVIARGALMQAQPAGAMLAVAQEETELLRLFEGRLDIAAVNGPEQCVLSGSTEDIKAAAEELAAMDVPVRILLTSHAFHSEMMAPVCERFRDVVSKTKLHAPTRPFLSNVTGDWIKDHEALDPNYWAGHIRSAVRFHAGIERIKQAHPGAVMIEVGPGRALSGLARQAGVWSISSLPGDMDESHELAAALAESWQAGLKVNWVDYYAAEDRQRVRLPNYPFARKLYTVASPGTPNAGIFQQQPPSGVVANPDNNIREPPVAMDTGENAGETLTDYERKVKMVWTELLGIPNIKTDSGFTEIGGSSLAAIKLVRRLNVTFGITLRVRDVLEASDIKAQAALIEKQMSTTADSAS
ncbi:acyltransferase domain-containing protein [Agrobacterium vitis]|nr:type I polyketide synthase [Agrobacterium vitis]MCM2442239.1 acyltransferase domain-containing protein [Agrobacterium vitis]